LIAERADNIIASALQPAWTDVLERVRELAAQLDGATDERAVIHAGERQRQAFIEIERLAARADSIRAAWRYLKGHNRGEDVHGHFMSFAIRRHGISNGVGQRPLSVSSQLRQRMPVPGFRRPWNRTAPLENGARRTIQRSARTVNC
jgi:hypothetical protein